MISKKHQKYIKSFYAAALKLSKRHFRNACYVSHIKLNELFDKQKVKANNPIVVRYFDQKVKFIST